jgi:hypothetical protein
MIYYTIKITKQNASFERSIKGARRLYTGTGGCNIQGN